MPAARSLKTRTAPAYFSTGRRATSGKLTDCAQRERGCPELPQSGSPRATTFALVVTRTARQSGGPQSSYMASVELDDQVSPDHFWMPTRIARFARMTSRTIISSIPSLTTTLPHYF